MTIVAADRKPLHWLTHLLWDELGWAWGLVAVAWALLLLTGHDHPQGNMAHLHHHPASAPLIARTIAQLLHSFGAWETMLVAMMLPSVLPIAKLFIQVSNRQENRVAPFAFLLGYLTIWTGFSLLMVGMPLLMRSVISFPPPLSVDWIRGITLLGVGLFQFTPLKQACLKGCRSAATTLAQYYQPGWQGGWQFGIEHGLYCLGCCWALMLEMAVLGLENLSLMLIFTAIMAIERLWKHGEAFAAWVGIGMIGLGGWTIVGVAQFP